MLEDMSYTAFKEGQKLRLEMYLTGFGISRELSLSLGELNGVRILDGPIVKIMFRCKIVRMFIVL